MSNDTVYTLMQGTVGGQKASDGEDRTLRLGNQGELISSGGLHGRYYEQTCRGNVYMGTVAVAGIALITTATGGGFPTIWNPAGSGVNVSLIRLSLNCLMDGNHAPGALGWYKTANTGASIGTGSPIATFTDITPISCLIGSAATGKARWSAATNTFTAAPAFLVAADFSLATLTAATAVAPYGNFIDYEGAMVIQPGVALSLCSTAASTTCKFVVKLVWEEIPL